MDLELPTAVKGFVNDVRAAVADLDSASPAELWAAANEQGWLSRPSLWTGTLFEALILARILGEYGIEARPLIDQVAWRWATESAVPQGTEVNYVGTFRMPLPDDQVYAGAGFVHVPYPSEGVLSTSSVSSDGASPSLGEWERRSDARVASRLYWLHRLLICSHANAAARVAIEIATEYSKERRQFGQAIGTFQGVQHTLVQAFSAVTSLDLLIERATQLLAENGPDSIGARGLLEIVVIRSQRVAWDAAIASHDVLGGAGFMRSHPLTSYSELLLRAHAILGERHSNWEASVDTIVAMDWLSTEGLAQA
ncbi:MAG: acyl-CoA dehydrogenase family protein [Trueperaceae bacterium]